MPAHAILCLTLLVVLFPFLQMVELMRLADMIGTDANVKQFSSRLLSSAEQISRVASGTLSSCCSTCQWKSCVYLLLAFLFVLRV